MGVTVKRPVNVKVIVTEQFKTRRAAQIRAAVARLEAVGRQIEAQVQRSGGAPESVVERLNAERRRNEGARDALAQELRNLPSLEIGAEYSGGTLEGLVEVEVGDDATRLGACEIVIKDDTIIEIRDGRCLEPNET